MHASRPSYGHDRLASWIDHGHIYMTVFHQAHVPSRPTPRKHTPVVALISASEFKATCLELMDDVARTGADVIVTKHGRPVVRVSAVRQERASPWGFLAGSVVSHGDIVSPDDAVWSASTTDPLSLRKSR